MLPALLIALIDRSAWNRNSAKFVCRILHRPGPMGGVEGLSRPRTHRSQYYILWGRIQMQAGE